MSEFEDRLREIAREIGRSVERNIDDVAETFGVDPDRARQFADAAGQWLNDHVESGDELFGRPAPKAAEQEPRAEKAPASRPGPHPLDTPTAAQGVALSAMDSGRWTVRPGSNQLTGTGEGADPAHASELVSELRARDWIKADGELTLVGRRALDRWCDTAEQPSAPATATATAAAPQPPADPS